MTCFLETGLVPLDFKHNAVQGLKKPRLKTKFFTNFHPYLNCIFLASSPEAIMGCGVFEVRKSGS